MDLAFDKRSQLEMRRPHGAGTVWKQPSGLSLRLSGPSSPEPQPGDGRHPSDTGAEAEHSPACCEIVGTTELYEIIPDSTGTLLTVASI